MHFSCVDQLRMVEQVKELLWVDLFKQEESFQANNHFTPAPLLAIFLSTAESEKTRQRVSNADRKVVANTESFCDKFIIG